MGQLQLPALQALPATSQLAFEISEGGLHRKDAMTRVANRTPAGMLPLNEFAQNLVGRRGTIPPLHQRPSRKGDPMQQERQSLMEPMAISAGRPGGVIPL